MGHIYKLIIEDDEGKTTVYPLSQGEISIGRKEGNTIRLMERNVSRRHARLLRNNGSVFVEDLDSYNGIRINGERINGRYEVKEGDLVEIGDYHLALQAAEVEEEANDRHTQPTLDDKRQPDKDEWPLAGTVPDFRLPEEILAGVRGQIAQPKPTIQNAASRDTLVDTPIQQVAPTPAVFSPQKNGGAQLQSRDPLISPPPRGDAEPPRSLPPFPLPGGVPPSAVPFLPPRNDDPKSKPSAPANKREAESLAPTTPINVGPQRVAAVPRLVCVSTSYAGREFSLTRPELIIGRVEDNDIVIEHRSVSRNHAKIVFDGRVHKIIDLQSANGILVNGEEYAMTDLRKNDLIELGHVRFRFVPAGEAFTASEDELREMREAGVTSPNPSDVPTSPPPLSAHAASHATTLPPHSQSSQTAPSRAPDMRAPDMPVARPAGLVAPSSQRREDAAEVAPHHLDPSTAATVTDTPLSALTVGLLTPELMPTPAALPNDGHSPRRIEEKRKNDPVSDRPAAAAPARAATAAHDQRPTEINIAARPNGSHGANNLADPLEAAAEAKKQSKARAATEPMPRPIGAVEVEGRLDAPRPKPRVGLMVGLGAVCLIALGLAIYMVVAPPKPDPSSNPKPATDAKVAHFFTDSDWASLSQYCAQHAAELKADAVALDRCDTAETMLKRKKEPEEGKIPAPPEQVVAQPEVQPEQKEPVEDRAKIEEAAEADRKAQATKKAGKPEKAVRNPNAQSPADRRAKAREVSTRARAALMNGEMTTAEEGFKECLKLAELPECHRNLGVLYAQIKDTAQSIKHYRKYLEISPNAQDADYIRGIVEGSQP